MWKRLSSSNYAATLSHFQTSAERKYMAEREEFEQDSGLKVKYEVPAETYLGRVHGEIVIRHSQVWHCVSDPEQTGVKDGSSSTTNPCTKAAVRWLQQ
jgi:hypothetical protein